MTKTKPAGSKSPGSDDALLLDHNYDGIQELDNPLPRWWLYLFYGCIVFAIGYWSYYTFLGGPTQDQELRTELQNYLPKDSPKEAGKAADGVDNDALEERFLSESVRGRGRTIFAEKCAACHGNQAQGLIGPNLTDAHWIHGRGKPADIVAIVKKGVPDKGMMSWEPLLNSDDIVAVSAYVHSLVGSHPPHPKSPQGTPVD